MELVHWLFIIFGIAMALTTQWCLLAPFSLEWKPLRDQITEQVTQSAALLEECASGIDARR